MSDPPPTYNESVKHHGPPPPHGYGIQPPYGAVPSAPGGGYTNPGYPPQPYPPATGYPSQLPPPQYPPQHQAGYGAIPGSYQQGNVVTTQYPPQSVVMVGGCPACRVGVLEDDFTCIGVLCAIVFFPLGVLCCLAMRQRRCVHCGAVFG